MTDEVKAISRPLLELKETFASIPRFNDERTALGGHPR